ncbi:hypothetical protein SEVIR_2G014701v4 [Setaria viridis]|uniref:Rx N-terminal domain-containing protein n=1 Tax=Setaria viridis TaxID=4556 RepID=A0A4U6VKD9_SETVI|nr:hypothetical protein SEVIR_2G014701v2 [Setaria viridis]
MNNGLLDEASPVMRLQRQITMEVPNSASTGAMGSLLCKLDELLRTTEDDDETHAIRQLRDDVSRIDLMLAELSEVHDPPLTVNYWMRDARELSYDMEYCIDLFVVVFHSDSDASKKTAAWTDEISGFRTRVEEVMERYYRFKLDKSLANPNTSVESIRLQIQTASRSQDLNTPAVDPIGMEGPKTELVRWLKPKGGDGEELQLKVVSILGVEGVGKSTLAQELWRILGEEFQCRAFVQASKKPNMRRILRSILLQVRPNLQPPEACQVPNLIRNITEHLQDKRFHSSWPYHLNYYAAFIVSHVGHL